jgi:uncharacterized protein YegP (UPF0339 family)
MPRKTKPLAHLEFTKDDRGKWRWRLTDSRNGTIVGAASQGYSRRPDALRNAEMVTGGYRVRERSAS